MLTVAWLIIGVAMAALITGGAVQLIALGRLWPDQHRLHKNVWFDNVPLLNFMFGDFGEHVRAARGDAAQWWQWAARGRSLAWTGLLLAAVAIVLFAMGVG